jgi:hypothetical protein
MISGKREKEKGNEREFESAGAGKRAKGNDEKEKLTEEIDKGKIDIRAR